ncbi:MAG TPA: TetR/AcrR family transcriptional regulator [Vicinamibacterales bacterium]|nr:TetR/AcrR family transcriptional regulator [Vicinamibacterales bacterium]
MGAERGRGPARGRRRAAVPADGSRARLLAAANREFAARGFAGASVDRIAASAGLNKAMIYYHFKSKAALYREIIRDMFDAFGRRVSDVAASHAAPADKIRQYVDAFAVEAAAHPHFPPIWFREVAEGGTHLDEAIVADMAVILRSLAAIIDEGVEQKTFSPVNPLLVHAGIVAPVLLYFATAGIRGRLERTGVRAAGVDRAQVVAHVQRVTLGLLEGRLA